MIDTHLLQLDLPPVTLEIIQHSNDFFGVADPEGKALFVNTAGRKIFGLGEDDDISGLTMLDFIARRDHELFLTEVVAPSKLNNGVRKSVHVRHFESNEVFMMDFSFFMTQPSAEQPGFFMAFGKDLRSSFETQELLRSIQDNLNVGGWQLDIENNHAIWSEKVYEIHKIPVGTPTHKIMAIDFYAPHERPRISDCIERCLEFGEPYDEEFEFFDAEGNHLWIRTTGKPVYNDAGEVVKLSGTFQDVTERKQLELKNEEANIELELFRSVIENSPDFIGISDTKNNPIYVNPAGRALLSIPEDADLRKQVTIADCFPERLRDKIVPKIMSALKTQGNFSGETVFRNFETNAEIPVMDNHFVIRDSRSGVQLGHATITRDVTHEVELRRQLEAEKTKLAQAAKMASLGELAAGIAHEINNPLTVISGSVSLLHRGTNDAKKLARAADRIDKSVERITAIVNGLRKFSRTDAALNLEPVDLSKVIRESTSLVAPKARNNNHRIEFTDGPAPAFCACDEIQMEQVIINLLVNSIDANANNADTWTRISLEFSGDDCVITVQDSGRGIDEALLTHIFDPFFTTKDVGAGTGLGLSISSGIVSDHGGKLDYQLLDGHTAFVIRLPKLD